MRTLAEVVNRVDGGAVEVMGLLRPEALVD
jgi:hypothetical protein